MVRDPLLADGWANVAKALREVESALDRVVAMGAPDVEVTDRIRNAATQIRFAALRADELGRSADA